jgi:hypothetical protein
VPEIKGVFQGYSRGWNQNRPNTDPDEPGDVMASLTLALIVVCVVGLAVETTRWLGVLALALLVVLFPIPMALLSLIGGAAYLYFHRRRNR